MEIPATATKTAAPLAALAVLAALLLISCGGGSVTPDAAPAPTPSPSLPEPPPPTAPLPSPPAPQTCNPGPTAGTGFSEVFKECVGTSAVYYPLSQCVKDNATGLIWEQKKTTGLQAANAYFTNFDSTTGDQVANSGSNGSIPSRPATQAEINAGYNTVGYINLINGLGVCGGTWRLPNRNELTGLFTRLDSNWVLNHMNVWGYWSSSTRSGISYSYTAYEVEHHGRSVVEVNREDGYFVRLVRN